MQPFLDPVEANRHKADERMSQSAYLSVRKIGKFERARVKAMLDLVVPRMDEPIPNMDGFGIITVAGGKYLRWFWASLHKLREVTDKPVQCWHIGERELNHPCVPLMREMGVEFVDALPYMKAENYQSRGGWPAKSIAVKYSPYQTVCFLDADAFPLIDPEEILEHPDFEKGFLCFPDIQKCRKDDFLFHEFNMKYDPSWVEAEAGQFLIDKKRFWKEVQLYAWMNGRPKPFHEICHGDKALLQLACHRTRKPFQMAGKPVWLGDGIAHNLTDGTPVFIHKMEPKRMKVDPPEMHHLLREFDEMTKLQAV